MSQGFANKLKNLVVDSSEHDENQTKQDTEFDNFLIQHVHRISVDSPTAAVRQAPVRKTHRSSTSLDFSHSRNSSGHSLEDLMAKSPSHSRSPSGHVPNVPQTPEYNHSPKRAARTSSQTTLEKEKENGFFSNFEQVGVPWKSRTSHSRKNSEQMNLANAQPKASHSRKNSGQLNFEQVSQPKVSHSRKNSEQMNFEQATVQPKVSHSRKNSEQMNFDVQSKTALGKTLSRKNSEQIVTDPLAPGPAPNHARKNSAQIGVEAIPSSRPSHSRKNSEQVKPIVEQK